MKSIKLIGLIALLALIAMAFVGASTAMATSTALCKEDPVNLTEEKCPAGKLVTHVHEATLAGSPAVLLSSAGNVLCDALFLGDTLESGLGNPLKIHGHFTYTNCVRHKIFGGTEACTVSEVSADSLIEVLKEGHETGKVTGNGEVKVECGSVINCTYDGENLIGTAKGPLLSTMLNGDVTVTNQTTHSTGGAFCPATGKLDIMTTPLEHTYIGK